MNYEYKIKKNLLIRLKRVFKFKALIHTTPSCTFIAQVPFCRLYIIQKVMGSRSRSRSRSRSPEKPRRKSTRSASGDRKPAPSRSRSPAQKNSRSRTPKKPSQSPKKSRSRTPKKSRSRSPRQSRSRSRSRGRDSRRRYTRSPSPAEVGYRIHLADIGMLPRVPIP